MTQPALRIENLRITFPNAGQRLPVVDGVSFEIARGEVLALVGESGCGKSMTAFAAMRLVPKPGAIEGVIELNGRDITKLPVPEMRKVRGTQLGMIFQEPMTSLSPVLRAGEQVVEAIRLHEKVSHGEARKRVIELFERVRIPDAEQRFDAYPHQLSGGLKQRVMIAMALATKPQVLIADEPTTALDVTIQAQVLELMRELQRESDAAILLITHDLGVVNELADRVAVMYAGRIVELGKREDVLARPRHPYTVGLLKSMPGLAQPGERLHEIAGVVPPPTEWTAACRFASRCPRVIEKCSASAPAQTALGDGHWAACFAVEQEGAR
ncbi:MAG: ABC transporter ATP-binding protein [Deltaproteobacteria bacterium]|nr:ABC transporter ATP-binding protein [Deltaproteobacteria bacterium]